MNEYIETGHEYIINGARVPSVTQVLPRIDFSHVAPDVLEAARLEGIKNHSKIENYWKTGETTFDSYVLEFDEFIKSIAPGKPVLFEHPLFSDKNRFGGTPDMVFKNCICDLKRSPGDPRREALQLAGYSLLCKENGVSKGCNYWFIIWHDGETFKFRNVYDPRAEAIFIVCLKRFYMEKEIKKFMEAL